MDLRYEELTYEELAQAARENYLVVLPAGCTEQQGPHLPANADTFLLTLNLTNAAKKLREEGVNVLLLPALPYGPAWEHMAFGGTISISYETHIRIVTEILDSLVQQGFRRLVVAEACGGHHLHPAAMEARYHARQAGKSVAIWRIPAGGRAWRPLLKEAFGYMPRDFHAGALMTSIYMYARPEAVRRDKLGKWDQGSIDSMLAWFTEETSPNGSGDPSGASAEAGERLASLLCEWYYGHLKRMATLAIPGD
ncbi:MAG: creatininase family protein [Chloroflexi bacterium]|nr:creatininase family protein [Chloroflexota bacterium]